MSKEPQVEKKEKYSVSWYRIYSLVLLPILAHQYIRTSFIMSLPDHRILPFPQVDQARPTELIQTLLQAFTACKNRHTKDLNYSLQNLSMCFLCACPCQAIVPMASLRESDIDVSTWNKHKQELKRISVPNPNTPLT